MDTGKLKVQSDRFALLDSLLEGCQIIDRQWRYAYLNEAAVIHSRKTRSELIGKRMTDAYPGIEKTTMFSALERVMVGQSDERIENEFTYPNGQKGWFELHIQPCPEGILILSQDITDKKAALRASQSEIKRLDTLRQIDLAITSSTDLSVVLDIVLDRMIDSLEVDAAAILLLDKGLLKLSPHRQRGFMDRTMDQMSVKLGDGIAGRTALSRETVAIDSIKQDGRFTRKGIVELEGFESYFATPLVAKGNLIGIVELFHRHRKLYDASWLNFFEIIAGQAAIAIDHIQTFGSLQRANIDLLLAYDYTIEGWAKTLEIRDIETEGHSRRVRELAEALARAVGVKRDEIIHLRRGAILHDIGKLGIPDSILLKPDKLTEGEWEVMRRHPEIGFSLVSRIDFLRPALDIIRFHHERWDGSGYPRGLRADLIPRSARIFSIVDVWDALRSKRPYRPPWDDDKARNYLREQSGFQFDPELVDAFLTMQPSPELKAD